MGTSSPDSSDETPSPEVVCARQGGVSSCRQRHRRKEEGLCTGLRWGLCQSLSGGLCWGLCWGLFVGRSKPHVINVIGQVGSGFPRVAAVVVPTPAHKELAVLARTLKNARYAELPIQRLGFISSQAAFGGRGFGIRS